ncbi:L-aspartate oxidase [Natronobacterium gregoryi]|uniref:L-aspartate oxidase n=2 Tax=Natronobacterium gregoryi TaxID=44930 RepID=L0AGS8_NATGS|nr:FAD-dependent oxidoreductase [Natronobacterium gregoryi]AFZ72372.1 aspartate oxidase [Natronobacterium gregoryi SP2]ELY64243.1 fumarate reductase/succinate dehydrogenase flavoprotein domain-containing protein [Natronobacterium gregoryi SP2]PLK20314.1 FAD-binding protein [Natronobacterium gregoryi SP2]SFJ22014.1 L-aspartate oxidase [Natronobacterium gregoryi]
MTTTTEHDTTDVLVVGSGIAGCAAALAAASEGSEVLLVTKATRPDGASTDWAQGGISTTRDDPESLEEDILEASDGTADPEAVETLVEHADDAVEDVLVETLEIPFDETDGGEFDYTREAAHSKRRILHVDAATGTHILRPFLHYVDDHERIEVRQDTAALELLTDEGRVRGILTDEETTGKPIYAGATVLATGGIGALYERSTNPDDATGDGIAMAALAGADVTDLEYVQFHPTAYAGDDPFLLSEALRGEGAVLRNANGDRFMDDYHPDADLAPRDIVARAVDAEREETGEVVLDVSPLEGEFEDEFPGIAEKCRDRGIDGDAIPVAPCEHFLCGGVDVDDRGRASLEGLYAVGECARTGVHGANRLASTSLLEGLVWGLRAGEDAASDHEPTVVEAPDLRNSDPDLPDRFAAEKFTRLRQTMDEYLGLERTPDEIARASAVLRRLKGEVDAYVRTRTARDLYELRNATVAALLIARAASENEESVGCHYVEETQPTGETADD